MSQTGNKSPFEKHWKSDILSGFLVFLIALPLCLGISMASGFPPVSGIFTAIIGGLIVTHFRGSNLTIKGPAAGLIVIALAAVEELGQGDPIRGYTLTLAVIVAAGIVQVVFGLIKSGILGDFFPLSAVHGMLAAIGIIIISKQAHTLLGVKPEGKDPLELLAEIPHSFSVLNPDIAIIGCICLFILFLLPLFRNKTIKKIPGPLLVLVISVPLGIYFGLGHEHKYLFLDNHEYQVGPRYLVTLPDNLFSAVTFPDFSELFTWTSLKYVIMFSMVGSLESLLSSKAIDGLDPYKRTSNHNRDMIGVGIGNTLSGLIGGLPMISEIVRSSANINNGAKTYWSNFFHGVFLFVFVVFFPKLIHQIPLAALASMLIYTGSRLASPREFIHTYRLGLDQFCVFITTLVTVIATDLLIGIAAGIVLNGILNIINGHHLKTLFRIEKEILNGKNDHAVIRINTPLGFTNYIPLKFLMTNTVNKKVDIDFSSCLFVDHTVIENLHHMQEDYSRNGRSLNLKYLNTLFPVSDHPLATKKAFPPRLYRERKMNQHQRMLKSFFKIRGVSFYPHKTIIHDPFHHFPSLNKVMVNYIANRAIKEEDHYSFQYFDLYANDDGFVSQYAFRSSVFILHSKNGSVIPPFVVHTETITDRLIDLFEKEDIDLHEQREFSSRFHLHGKNKAAIKAILNEKLIRNMMNVPDIHLECNGKSIIMLSNYVISDKEDLRNYMHVCESLGVLFEKSMIHP
ncbi:MAG: SulP family inorganic anion transporter [Flavobacteriales bacterium]